MAMQKQKTPTPFIERNHIPNKAFLKKEKKKKEEEEEEEEEEEG